MHASFQSQDNPLIRKLESVFTLTAEVRQALRNLPMQLAVIKDDQDIVREGDRPTRCCLILSGFAATYKITADGKRQITSFGIAGDIPDLHSLHLKVLDNSVSTLSTCRVGFIIHDDLRDLCERYPRIAAALWRETLIDGAIFREWMLNIGRREAYNRIAHLFCEMQVRLSAVGLVEDYAYDLPITQAELGDALGITTVHVNRVLQQMRADGLIVTKRTRLAIPDWDKLKEVGEFNPSYLQLEQGDLAAPDVDQVWPSQRRA
ncbi:Crp/Fnr family transcriptional regulator [Microvirga sp. VF16]|uniref:Crp/Fnr family transcriptional regulator n=1 Tax=Microvirga sp. VF16 TaxID=2807101 RepID=UPI00193DB0A2|nr:Crp/Fnr family transcriptional regulator [Microvirga sp. VF16]QRM33910.1 Crp/Fnr family transcriptional regulator [Microvirga sp. VF16]